jgi:hypothetical protein
MSLNSWVSDRLADILGYREKAITDFTIGIGMLQKEDNVISQGIRIRIKHTIILFTLHTLLSLLYLHKFYVPCIFLTLSLYLNLSLFHPTLPRIHSLIEFYTCYQLPPHPLHSHHNSPHQKSGTPSHHPTHSFIYSFHSKKGKGCEVSTR